jgi:hypothetical protein
MRLLLSTPVCGWASATAQNGQVLFELFELAEVGVAGGGEWMFIAERAEAGGR